jgi:energy-coupling factor transporter ATP-binding protein EcfA2
MAKWLHREYLLMDKQEKARLPNETGEVVYGNKISGDLVGGDKFAEINVQDSQAVAIGAGAQATINQYTEIIVRLDNIEEMPPAPGSPPYKGLAYYTEADADLFFGREQLSEKLLLRLRTSQFLAVVGASGSGKSSLLRAGVIPKVRAEGWLVHLLTPTAHPLERLAQTLTRDSSAYDLADKVCAGLQTNPRTLRQVAGKLVSQQDAARLLLVIDQFEELFTLCKEEETRQAFLANLLTAASDQGVVTILIGIRADFYERCAYYDGLRELVAQHHELIGPMNQADIVRVIAEPARRGGWQFVTGLVEQMVENVGQEPGRLPLLSHALLETWQRRRGVVMTLGGYRAAGSVEGAIAKSAENVIQMLDDGQRAIAERIFLALTELGEGAADTRRIASRAALRRAEGGDAVDAVLEMLVAARLIAVNKQEVEVAHEALIRRWPRLQSWLDTNRERLRFERQLARDAELWQETMNRDPGTLYRGARLAQALEWQARDDVSLEPLSAEFLAESHRQTEQEAYEKEALYKRQLLARYLAGAAILILLLVAGIAAFPALQNRYYQQQARAPLVEIQIPAGSFFLEAHEVSNQQYAYCVWDGACGQPQDPTQGYFEESKKRMPVVAVSAYQANQYCQWLGRRLPTIAEWNAAYEYGRLLPDPPHLGNSDGPLETQPVQPENHDEGVIYHLVGNIWEWTASIYSDDGTEQNWDGELSSLCVPGFPECRPYSLHIIGGAVDTDPTYHMPEDFYYFGVFSSFSYIGFRCAL